MPLNPRLNREWRVGKNPGSPFSASHSFSMRCRVVSKDEAFTRAHPKLVGAAKIVLSLTLHLLGMTASERM